MAVYRLVSLIRKEFIQILRDPRTLAIAYFIDSEAELSRLIDNRKAKTGIIIHPRYSDDILDNDQANVAFI